MVIVCDAACFPCAKDFGLGSVGSFAAYRSVGSSVCNNGYTAVLTPDSRNVYAGSPYYLDFRSPTAATEAVVPTFAPPTAH